MRVGVTRNFLTRKCMQTTSCSFFLSMLHRTITKKMLLNLSRILLYLFIIQCESLLRVVCNSVVEEGEAPRMEVMVVAFGWTGPMALTTLSRSTPIYELAVNDLARRYNGSLRFSYTLVPGRICLRAAQREEDVLAKGYYELRRPNRVLVFISPGFEPGNVIEFIWGDNTGKKHLEKNFLLYRLCIRRFVRVLLSGQLEYYCHK